MQIIEVDSEFPKKNPANGIEKSLADLNNSFFDIIFYSNCALEDKADWTKGKITYALFEGDNIPFFIIDFGGKIQIDVSINIHLLSAESAETWLNEKGNIISLFLIDSKTNVLRGMRAISIYSTVASAIKDCLEKQETEYDSPEEVTAAQQKIMNVLTTEKMFQVSKRYSL